MEFFIPFFFSCGGAKFFVLTLLFFCEKFGFFFEEFLQLFSAVIDRGVGSGEFLFGFFGEFEVVRGVFVYGFLQVDFEFHVCRLFGDLDLNFYLEFLI